MSWRAGSLGGARVTEHIIAQRTREVTATIHAMGGRYRFRGLGFRI
jgi:hypothetical protein